MKNYTNKYEDEQMRIFEVEKRSIAELSESELFALSLVAPGNITWENYFMNCVPVDEEWPILRKPPEWLISWSTSLTSVDLYWIEDDIPDAESLMLICDESRSESWIVGCSEQSALTGCRIPMPRSELTPELVWPVFQKEFSACGDNFLYAKFYCNPKWLPREELEGCLRRRMCEAGVSKLIGDNGPITLKQWIKQNYKNRKI